MKINLNCLKCDGIFSMKLDTNEVVCENCKDHQSLDNIVRLGFEPGLDSQVIQCSACNNIDVYKVQKDVYVCLSCMKAFPTLAHCQTCRQYIACAAPMKVCASHAHQCTECA